MNRCASGEITDGSHLNLMKTLILLSLFVCSSIAALSAEILYSDHRDTASFKRISEHLTGKENAGRYHIFRTDPDARDGYYVALKLADQDSGDRIRSIKFHFVSPGSLEVETQTLDAAPVRKQRLLVGLTHGTWSQSQRLPTAWKLDFLDGDGETLFSSQSFLWSTDPS